MRRILKYIAIALFMVLAIAGWYLFTFCDYKSYFVITDENEGNFVFADSLSLRTNVVIEDHISDGKQVITAHLSFDAAFDSIVIKFLKVNISCLDNSQQIFCMSQVLTYVDPLIPEDINYVSAKQFDSLPEHYKMVTKQRQPWTTYRFYFENKDIDSGTIYIYQIVATILYNGKIFTFTRNVRVKRRKHFTYYQIMT